jgi:hypothetical protein
MWVQVAGRQARQVHCEGKRCSHVVRWYVECTVRNEGIRAHLNNVNWYGTHHPINLKSYRDPFNHRHLANIIHLVLPSSDTLLILSLYTPSLFPLVGWLHHIPHDTLSHLTV